MPALPVGPAPFTVIRACGILDEQADGLSTRRIRLSARFHPPEISLSFQLPRGTFDILPDEQPYWRRFHSAAEQTADRFGYRRIDTPVFEDAGLFVRGIGEVTDIVEKETYTFEDRGGDLLTLRPEGTAPVCRAFLEHGMHNLPQPVRLFYLCPVFRYERPQSGRYRQHHQFGIETFGDGDASVDAEVIEVAWSLLETVGLTGLNLGINSIGDSECRPGYIDALKRHYQGQTDRICEDCTRRLEQNPLRLLDCKQEACQQVIEPAPKGADHLCDRCRGHWYSLQEYLTALGLSYEVDHRLVRGFDYYTRTVFEITPPLEGRQSTIVGGGRYDGLIEQLGGRPTPGIGFGMGIERVIASLKESDASKPVKEGAKVLIAHAGAGVRQRALALASAMRRSGVSAILASGSRSLRSQLRYASSIEATHAIIVGEEELERGVVTLRDMARGEQREVDERADALVRAVRA